MLTTNFCGIEMKNPIVAASGTFGFGMEYRHYVDLNHKVGAVSVKGLTPEPRSGNAGRRIAETSAGILNCVGLENPGMEKFRANILPHLRRSFDVPVIANISGHNVEDYKIITEYLNVEGVAAFEVNVSCPNVADGGMAFGVNPDMVYQITKTVREYTNKPVIVKLSPNVTDIALIAKAAEEGKADGVSLINTLLGMAVDVKTWTPSLGNVYGGLSGPAVKPVALRMVHQVAKTVSIPILGGGGIMTAEDVIEFMLVGASAVTVGTANMVDPRAIGKIHDDLEAYLKAQGIDHISKIVGKLNQKAETIALCGI